MNKTGTKRPVKREGRTLLDTVRKPASPPGHPLSRAKPEGRAHPAERKVKHKRPPGDGE
jgi:hypothetical protein